MMVIRLYLSSDDVTLHQGFHNTYDLDCPDAANAERFVNRMNGLIRTYKVVDSGEIWTRGRKISLFFQ